MCALSNQQAMQIYCGGSGGEGVPLILKCGTGWQSAIFTLQPLYFPEKSPVHTGIGDYVPQIWYGLSITDDTSLCPCGIEPRLLSHPAHSLC
jgi:hypothetical protein